MPMSVAPKLKVRLIFLTEADLIPDEEVVVTLDHERLHQTRST